MSFYRCKTLEEKESQAQEFIERVTELTGFHTSSCYNTVINETHAEFQLQSKTM